MSGHETKKGVKWKSEYPIHEVHQVALGKDEGLFARVDFTDEQGKQQLIVHGPRVTPFAHEFLDGCYEIRIIDRNSADGNCVEYSRWRVELWDEDDPYCTFECDEFEVMQFDEPN